LDEASIEGAPNGLLVKFIEMLGACYQAGKISDRDYRLLFARTLGLSHPTTRYAEKIVELFVKTPVLQNAFLFYRTAFLASMQPRPDTIARNFLFLEERLKCQQLLAAAERASY
jgi:hypothetical protein